MGNPSKIVALNAGEDGVGHFLWFCCGKNKNKVVAEYALRNVNSPMSVAEFETKVVDSLPKELKNALLAIEEIEREFEGE